MYWQVPPSQAKESGDIYYMTIFLNCPLVILKVFCLCITLVTHETIVWQYKGWFLSFFTQHSTIASAALIYLISIIFEIN